jgi:Tol biopolymer transport system component
MRVPVSGGASRKLADLIGFIPLGVSPDGKLLTSGGYSFEEHKDTIVLMDAESGKTVRTFSPHGRFGGVVRFSRDGKNVAYSATENGVGNLWIQPLDGGAPHQITNFHSELIRDFQWSPDGKKLALVRGHTDTDIVLLTDTSR